MIENAPTNTDNNKTFVVWMIVNTTEIKSNFKLMLISKTTWDGSWLITAAHAAVRFDDDDDTHPRKQ